MPEYKICELGGLLKWMLRFDNVYCVDPRYFDEWMSQIGQGNVPNVNA